MTGAEVALIGSLVSTAFTVKGAMDEKEAAKDRAKEEERLTQENVARLKTEQEETLGGMQARAAASGIDPGVGTTPLMMQTTKSRMAADISEMERAGASRARIERKVGEMEAMRGFGKAFGTAAKGIGGYMSKKA